MPAWISIPTSASLGVHGRHLGVPRDPGGQFGLELLAQPERLQLGRGHRPLGHEPHVAWHLEAGQAAAAVRDDLLFGQVVPGCSSMKAAGTSPYFSSATPTTCATLTQGCACRYEAISRA